MSVNKKIKILLIEDDDIKVRKIEELIKLKSTSDYEITVKSCSNDARNYLKTSHVDLLILDLCIPRLINGLPIESEGATLFKEIHTRNAYSKPIRTIVLSAYEEVNKKYEDTFDEYSVTCFKYDEQSDEWGEKLAIVLNTLSESFESKRQHEKGSVNVVVLTALRTELEAVLRYMNCNWSKPEHIEADLTIYRGTIKTESHNISIVACHALKMGLLPSAILSYQLIDMFSPNIIIMTGICAGRNKKINLGDVVAASCSWDWQAGRIEEMSDGVTNKHRPDYYQIATNVDRAIEDLIMDRADFLNIWDNYQGAKKSSAPSCLVKGPMASGSVVIAATEAIGKIIEQHQAVIGFDMETYGVYYACSTSKKATKFLSIKGVCDFADNKKNNDFQPYAAYMSAKVCELLLQKQAARLLA